MDLREVELEGMDWNNLAENRHVVGCCECGDEPVGSIKCREFLD